MTFESSGFLVTATKTAAGKPSEVSITANVPANTSVDATINQDTSGGGTPDNSQVVSVSDGTNTYPLSGFADATGASYWIRFDLSTSDTSVTPSVDAATVTTQLIIDAPVTAVSTSSPTPSVSASGTATVDAPETTLDASTPTPGVSGTGPVSVSAPPTTVSTATPEPTVAPGSVSLDAPTTTLTLSALEPVVAYDQWQIGDSILRTYTHESATHRNVTLHFRVSTADLTSVARQMKTDENKIDVLVTDDGGFSAVDRAGGANTFTLTPPARRQPLRQEGTYHVARYEESLVSQTVEEWDVEVEFVRDSDRSDTRSISESGGAWTLETRYGTIATDRVDAEFLGTGASGVERFELTARLTYAEALAWEAALSRLDGTRIRSVPDGANQAVDDTAGDVNTVTVTSPTPSVVSSGDYVVMGWRSERLNEAYQEVSIEVAKK